MVRGVTAFSPTSSRSVQWSDLPIGAPDTWPTELDWSLSLCLRSVAPVILFWGAELSMLHNDAAAPFFEKVDDHAFGRPLDKYWTNMAPIIRPHLQAVVENGVGSLLKKIQLSLTGGAGAASDLWDLNLVPVFDAGCTVAGVMAFFNKTTNEAPGKMTQVATFQLAEAIRALEDPTDIMATAAAQVGHELCVARVGYAELDPDGEHFVVEREWSVNDSPSQAGRYRLEDFGRELASRLRAGIVVRVNDAMTDSVAQPSSQMHIDLRARASVSVPLIRRGQLCATLYVNQPTARSWTDEEVEYLLEAANRTWAALERARAERALRESEERLQTLTNLVPAFVWFAEPDGELQYLNRRWYEYTGQKPAEALPDGWSSTLHPDDVENTAREWAEARALGVTYENECRYRCKDGRYRWHVARAEPLRSSDGKISGWFGTSLDIHDRKLAEAALRSSEEQFRLLADSSPALIWVTDERAQVVFANRRYEEIFGRPAEDIEGEGWRRIVHPDDVETFNERFLAALAARTRFVGEVRVIDIHGETMWLHCEGVPRFGPDGAFTGYVGANLDITDLKRTEARLRESEARLRLAVDAGRMAIYDHDFTTDELRHSPELNRLLGFPADQQLTMSDIRARYAPGEMQRLSALRDAALERGEGFPEVELQMSNLHGRPLWFLLRAETRLDDRGSAVSSTGVLLDITERKRAEEHQRLLMNELNHRAKNLLAIIQGIAQQTFRDPAIPRAPKVAFEGRLGALAATHSLLAEGSWEAASIHQVISEAAAAVTPRFDCLEIRGPDLLLPPKTAVSLGMAVHELCTNALKYGALSLSEGKVLVSWCVANGRLKLVWREKGGPAVKPPEKSGFGSRLIERGLAAELGGTVRIAYEPGGVVCTVDARLPVAAT